MNISSRGSFFWVTIASLVLGLSFIGGSFAAAHLAQAQAVPTVTLSPLAAQSVTQGNIAEFTASATDSDTSGTVAYALVSAPSGATIDPVSGIFSWDTTGAQPDVYSFSVTATGSTGGSDSQDTSISVIEVASSTNGTGGVATTTGGTVDTGDAVASTTVDNGLNSNTVNPDVPDSEMNSSTLTASSTNDGVLGSAATSTAATGDNTVTGGTAENTIVTGNAVSTANVINEVNTNIFNSDGLILFINQLFGGGIDLNQFDLSYFFAGSPGASPDNTLPGTNDQQCTLLTCLNSSALNVINTNTATVTNSVIVRSSTGGNTASSTGNAGINTGDAYAAANVLNLVNTNVINSSYLLLSFNNFGDMNANVTLPPDSFFNQLFLNGGQEPSLNSSSYNVNNTNTATTTGSVTAEAGTGDNTASTTDAFATATTTPDQTATTTPGDDADATAPPTGDGQITTGNAYSSATSFNQENTTDVGGTSVFLLFRVAGNWSGTIENLPAGLSWSEISNPTDPNESDIEIVSDNSTTTPLGAPETCTYETTKHGATAYNNQGQGVLAGGPCFNSSSFLASSTNLATLQNNVDVSAQTGGNDATTDTGVAGVNTGNAYAAANVVNLVNTDIVGQNWLFAVFNIFGNLNGNIIFAGPSFAVTAQVAQPTVSAGAPETYTFNVTNSGEGEASDAQLTATFDNTLLSFNPAGVTAIPNATGETWDLGPIAQGQTKTFTVTAQVGSNFPAGASATVPLTAAVTNNNKAAFATSNTVNAPIVVTSPLPAPASSGGGAAGGGGSSGGGGGGGGGGGISGGAQPTWTADPQISVVKTVDVSTTTAPTSVDYQVVVSDPDSAGPAYNSTLTDTLTDPKGNTMYTRSWELDTINPGDLITLTYTVAFGASTTPGMYHNVATVTGEKSYIGNVMSTLASGTGNVDFLPNGLVLGDSTSSVDIATSTLSTANASSTNAACAPLISSYLRPGQHAADVTKLQSFLDAIGSSIPTTGFFGPITTNAVKNFQETYASDILAPVGLTKPTGLVYSATIHKINQLACGGVDPISAVAPAAPVATVAAPSAPKKPSSAYLPKTITLPKPIVTQASASSQNSKGPNPASTTAKIIGAIFSHLF